MVSHIEGYYAFVLYFTAEVSIGTKCPLAQARALAQEARKARLRYQIFLRCGHAYQLYEEWPSAKENA